MFSTIKSNTCKGCGKSNPILYTSCRHCSLPVVGKNDTPIKEVPNTKNAAIKRFDMLIMLSDSFDKITETINDIPESTVPYADKFRMTFLLVSMAKNGCDTCLKFLDDLVKYATNKTVEQFDNIIDQCASIMDHLQEYEESNFKDENVHQIQSHIFDFKIRRNDLSSEEHSGYSSDEYDFNGEGEYAHQEKYEPNTPATHKQIALIKQIPTDKVPDDEDCNCPVCLDKLNTQSVVVLPCGHFYHNDCIMNWFKTGNRCPLGRCPVVPLKEILLSKQKN